MRWGRRITNPGELRTSIVLEQPASTADAGGFQTLAYTAVATVFCRWRNLRGRELFENHINTALKPARVLMRYRSDIDISWTVSKDGQRYEITGFDNLYDRNEYIELTVQRAVGD